MIPNIFSLLGESIVGKHIAKGIIFSNSPKKFHPNGSRIQVVVIIFHGGCSISIDKATILTRNNTIGRGKMIICWYTHMNPLNGYGIAGIAEWTASFSHSQPPPGRYNIYFIHSNFQIQFYRISCSRDLYMSHLCPRRLPR